MKYPHLMAYIARQCWAMEPTKLAAMFDALRIKCEGGDLDFRGESDNGGVAYMAQQARLTPARADKLAAASGDVAVLPVRGVLTHRMGSLEESSGNTTCERLSRSLHDLLGNDRVKAIVMDINSPGGSTDGVAEVASEIRAAREIKPIIASVNCMAASGAYWIAAQATDIAVTPSGSVGSIGVYTLHMQAAKFFEEMGVQHTFIYAGEHKVKGNPYEPLSEETIADFQKDVDAFYGMFVNAVAEGRGVDASVVREKFGQGRMVLAEAAVKAGMADRVATLEQTLNRYGASMNGQNARQRAGGARRAQLARDTI